MRVEQKWATKRGDKKVMGRGHSSNDDRSNSLNPNNAAHTAASNNHANQENPNNAEYKK